MYTSCCRWISKNLAAAVGVPVDVLNRRINFWISKVSSSLPFSSVNGFLE